MANNSRSPGISREHRISSDGLERLEKHLALGTRISRQVLAQWVRRYGEAAREVMRRYHIDCDDL